MSIYLLIWEQALLQTLYKLKMQKNKEQNPEEHFGSQRAAQAELRHWLSPNSRRHPGCWTLHISGTIFPEAAAHVHTQFSPKPLCKQHRCLGLRRRETTIIAELCTGQALPLSFVSCS